MTPVMTRLALLAVVGAGTAFAPLALPAYAAPAATPALNCALPANAKAPACKNARRPGRTPASPMNSPKGNTMGKTMGKTMGNPPAGPTMAPPAANKGPQRGPNANAPSMRGPANFSAPDRANFHQRFRGYRFPSFAAPNFGINLGVAVPRSYRLQPVPSGIYRYYPGFRGYLYFVLRDGRVVIVDQRSLRIVAII